MLLDLAETCVGILVTIACALSTLLLAVALPPVVLLQRSLLHSQLKLQARTDPKTGRRSEIPAIIRGAPDGVMLQIDGKLEALHCAGLPESVVLDREGRKAARHRYPEIAQDGFRLVFVDVHAIVSPT